MMRETSCNASSPYPLISSPRGFSHFPKRSTMTKRVLDVGNCDMDHGNLRVLIEGSFDAQLVRCHTAAEALAELRKAPADLVLVNRRLDHDLTEGVDVIRDVKAD